MTQYFYYNRREWSHFISTPACSTAPSAASGVAGVVQRDVGLDQAAGRERSFQAWPQGGVELAFGADFVARAAAEDSGSLWYFQGWMSLYCQSPACRNRSVP